MNHLKHIFLALPAYGGVSTPTLRTCVALAASAPVMGLHLHYADGERSLLNMNFNELWASALNQIDEGVPLEWFVMLHSDIGTPDTEWLVKLIGTAEMNHLDALAGVAMIKDSSGDTSTALWKDGDIHRLSLTELREMPCLLTNEWTKQSLGAKLLINTGMLALRLGREWNTDGFAWASEDTISRNKEGRWQARTLSEDWRMSLWFDERNIPYGVVQTIPVIHKGIWVWGNEVKDGN